MNYPQQGYPSQTPPAPQTQFQAPQYTQPYATPQQQPQYTQPGPAGQVPQTGPTPARGSLGQGWDQGARTGGHGSAAKFDQQGSIFEGFVARDMVDGDCRQAREPSKDGNGALKFFRKSGQPQFEYTIPCNVQPSPVYTDGKATLFTSKYRLHSAVVRAMIEQNYQAGEGLREGDYIWVQRIGDVQSGMGQPGHDFVAKITRREFLGGGQGQVSPALAGQAESAQAPFQPAQGATEYAAPTTANFNTTAAAPPTVAQAPSSAPVTSAAPVTAASPVPGLTAEQAELVRQYGGTLPQG
jgi:hypothetical protein